MVQSFPSVREARADRYFFDELMRLAGRGAETVLGRGTATGSAASSAGAGSMSRVVTFMLPGTIWPGDASPVVIISISGAASSTFAGAAAYWRPGQPPFCETKPAPVQLPH